MGYRRKLIEVALPLDAVNTASAREKSIRLGHPSTLHLWWARRPLAACRAVLFASLVDDPSARPDLFPTEEAQNAKRKELFDLIEELVLWKNSNDPEVLAKARSEIAMSCNGQPPAVLDPFAGGGSIPLEAQRLGLEAHASDLNPVAVLINKALIEIPPLFAGQPPVHADPERPAELGSWSGAQGLAADVRYFGQWMRDQAEVRIGHLYPKVELPKEHGGGAATVVAWLWTRTVCCPNPACGAEMPLASSWWLSKKKNRLAWVEPVLDPATRTIHYEIGTGTGGPPDPPKIGRAKFRCICCGEACPDGWVKTEAAAGRMSAQLMAMSAEGKRRRVYLSPTEAQRQAAQVLPPDDPPTGEIPNDPRAITVPSWGMYEWADLFTPRQLTALCTFSDLVAEAREKVLHQALDAGLSNDPTPLRDSGTGAFAYAEAVSVYLAFAVDRTAMAGNSLCRWNSVGEKAQHFYGRQAIPMIWDFAETNPMCNSTGSLKTSFPIAADVLEASSGLRILPGNATQLDAASIRTKSCVVATDPPYYDNIGYADLSDFFYVLLRRTLGPVFPEVCSTLLTPKAQELIAAPYRYDGDKKQAESFFEDGLRKVFARLCSIQDPRFPMTVYYAFKQAETTKAGTASTGWETMLQGLLNAGLTITGTWPVRSELSNRMRSLGSNALASSIVLVCRPRPDDAPLTSRRDFLNQLVAELPDALHKMRQGNIAPVDLAQAAIGPGMEVFSRYAKVVEADGSQMTVRDALSAINQTLDEALESADVELDKDTRWALTWHAQHSFEEGDYGQAEQLSISRNTSVTGLIQAGIAMSGGGIVRLLSRDELDPDRDPIADTRPTVWEVTQHLVRELEEGGEQAAANLLRSVGGLAEPARELAYRLYHTCERKGWASDALAYNSLVTAWPDLTRLAHKPPISEPTLDLDV